MTKKYSKKIKGKPAQHSEKKRADDRIIHWVIFFFSFGLFFNTISHDFTLDDVYLIQNNPFVNEGISAIPQILTTDYWEGPLGDNKVSKLYRPLSLVTFAIENSITGLKPGLSHLINIILFGLTCVFVYRFLRLLFPALNKNILLFTALLFAAHPLHTESVANLKGRAEIMAALFMFASLFQLLIYLDKKDKKHLTFSAILFFTGLLSKEDAITFTAIVPLILWFRKPADFTIALYFRKQLPLIFLFTGLAIIMLFMRNTFADVPDKSFSYIENPLESVAGFELLLNALNVSLNYITQIFFPVYLIHDYSYNQIPLVNGIAPGVLAGLILMVAALYFGVKLSIKKRPEGFALLFFLITFSVASNLFVLIGVMKAERLMFTPLLGGMLFLTAGTYTFFEKKNIRLNYFSYGCIAIIILFGLKTISRNPDWKNNDALIAADIEKSPENVKTKSNYAGILRDKASRTTGEQQLRLLEEAKVHLLESSVIAPDYIRPWIDLGYIYEMTGKYDSAAYVFSEAFKINPEDRNLVSRLHKVRALSDPEFRRAVEFVNSEKYAQAITILDSMAKVHPGNFEIQFYRGGISLNLGRLDTAITSLQRAREINPYDTRVDEPLEMAKKARADRN